jgi:hypothetical protein
MEFTKHLVELPVGSHWIRINLDRELNMELSSATPTVFKTILDPLLPLPLLRASCSPRKDNADVYSLSLAPFVINLVFAVLNNIKPILVMVNITTTPGVILGVLV